MSSDDLVPSINRLIEAVREDRAERRASEREEREERRDADKERRDVAADIIDKLGALHTSLLDARAVTLAAIVEEAAKTRHDARNALTPFVVREHEDRYARAVSLDTAAAGDTAKMPIAHAPLVDPRIIAVVKRVWPLLLAAGTFAAGWAAKHVSVHP